MTSHQKSLSVVELFSENIAEIRSYVYEAYISRGRSQEDAMNNENYKALDKIYQSMFLESTPVLLVDKDGRNMNEFKTSKPLCIKVDCQL